VEETKEKFLELLEKDKEFRYAVAGYLGFAEILKRLDSLEETQNKIWEEIKSLRDEQSKIWEEIKSLREGQNKLWEEIKSLRDEQSKIWEEIKSLREGQNKLWENQNRMWEEIRKIWEEIKKLREDQNKLWEEVREIRLEIKLLREDQEKMRITLERLTLSVEDEARDVISHRLKKELGIDIKLERIFIDEKEINIYGISGEICVIGEATVRLGTNLVEELERKIEKIKRENPELLKPKLIKVIYADYSVPNALELASNYNIWVLNWKGDLTSRKIIQ